MNQDIKNKDFQFYFFPIWQITMSAVLSGIQDEVGHLGRNRSLQLAQDRFFWPKMTKDIETYIKNCPWCLRRKSPKPVAQLVSISSSQLL